ncbi:MAG: zf-HC2 domain-containing protein [Candidatus Nitrohelix vancouverensis]|uniref:Zf-HC2 domain-containing protein n=1 Tax=Candidatus Nitrohelix vancouverensis TaxID=2705534 RepID=A0A7T0C2A3_9BACT|nr:MAG: zf-HC2 domain-containing protein [Candidatus Nitrohelix vancouverensis]
MMKLFKMTCEDTSPLLSESLDHPLPLGKRLRVKIHLAMCKFCRFYVNQMLIIRNLAHRIGREDDPAGEDRRLTDEAKTRIKLELKNHP